MPTPEGKLKDEVKAFLKTLPKCWYFMPVPMGYGIRGIPDFIGCFQGRFFAIETKRPRAESRPWQEKVHNAIRTAGGICWRVDSMDEVKDMF